MLLDNCCELALLKNNSVLLVLNLSSLHRKSLAKPLMSAKELVSHIQHRLNCKAVGFFVFLHLLKKAEA